MRIRTARKGVSCCRVDREYEGVICNHACKSLFYDRSIMMLLLAYAGEGDSRKYIN